MNTLKLQTLLQSFFIEDIGDGDITCEAIFSSSDQGKAVFTAKQSGIIAGVELIKEGFHLIDPNVKVNLGKKKMEMLLSLEIK